MSQLRMKVLIISVIIAILALASLSSSLVIRQEETDRAAIRKANAEDALALEEKFKTLTEDSECEPNDQACIGGAFAKCTTVAVDDDGKPVNRFSIQPCNGEELKCHPLPLVNSRGTSLVCTTQQDFEDRIKQAQTNA